MASPITSAMMIFPEGFSFVEEPGNVPLCKGGVGWVVSS